VKDPTSGKTHDLKNAPEMIISWRKITLSGKVPSRLPRLNLQLKNLTELAGERFGGVKKSHNEKLGMQF
jgi:hypothetical protein